MTLSIQKVGISLSERVLLFLSKLPSEPCKTAQTSAKKSMVYCSEDTITYLRNFAIFRLSKYAPRYLPILIKPSRLSNLDLRSLSYLLSTLPF